LLPGKHKRHACLRYPTRLEKLASGTG